MPFLGALEENSYTTIDDRLLYNYSLQEPHKKALLTL